MRTVNLITWDLVKREFNISAKKGQSVNIVRTESIWTNSGVNGKSNIFILKAR